MSKPDYGQPFEQKIDKAMLVFTETARLSRDGKHGQRMEKALRELFAGLNPSAVPKMVEALKEIAESGEILDAQKARAVLSEAGVTWEQTIKE